ncbi:lysine decarboxylase [Prochlorococcus marinus]|uniref:Lysine decarboxylase n=1 Tax=Prochlorococcus marinus XMU1408 TaxID=2213228 RepID=A0A318QXV0_PROMR|nr:lysine decarboxylase [Prochlorococcus marinus]MBW3042271.1 lysine decarboxylase [Prochlorococcus marinus str. XMU1408]PYE01659.1 lysine decarboxylase [Prochlorococcus marinus XMU1408]
MGLITLLSGNKSENLFLPAHGRGNSLPKKLRKLLKLRPGIWDLPELFEIGGPLIGEGAVAESQKSSASEVGVDRCWYGVNGATGLLQSSLLALARPGQAVLMPRNIHKSCIQACLFGGLTPILFDVPFLSDRGHAYIFDRSWLQRVFIKAKELEEDIAAVVLVNPSYQGYSADMEPLIKEVHSHSLPVLVDEAHGGYLVSQIRADLPKSALTLGADLVVHSLHKSAPGLVQSAVLWSQGDKVDPFKIERSIELLQTSSPSSLLLASCESSIKELIEPKGQKKLNARIEEAESLSEFLISHDVPLLQNSDPLRLILHTSKYGLSGIEVDKKFIDKRIIGELAEPGTLTFCLGFSSHKGLKKKFVRVWNEILKSSNSQQKFSLFKRPPFNVVSKPLNPCSSSWGSNFESVSLKESIGRISVDMVCPYPPGIPLLVPGEVLDKARVDWLVEQRCFWPDQISDFVRVIS